jgi:hypothetical protein
MTDFQIKQLAIVAAVALIMAAILVYWIFDARRRRAEDRAASDLRLEVTVVYLGSDREQAAWDDYADDIDDRLASAGIGHVEDMSSEPGRSAGEGHLPQSEVCLEVVLTSGSTAIPTLKRILREAGVPANALIEYPVGGIVARDRVGR